MNVEKTFITILIYAKHGTVSDKDLKVVNSMKKQFLEKGFLSKKQMGYLDGILHKYTSADDDFDGGTYGILQDFD